MKRLLTTALAAAALAAGSAPALAANVSFTGNLAGDNEVQLFSFTLAGTSDVKLRTWSYAGGVNAAGNGIAAGGFDPIVSLFFGTGDTAILLGQYDDVSVTVLDSLFDSVLESLTMLAGTYTVALTQSANFANGGTLGDGFLGAGSPNFGGRTSAWALDILGVDAANRIPVPTTLALALLGLAAAGVARRRRQAVNAVPA